VKIVAVIPVKLNNERAPGKNIKRFSDGTPLIHCVQAALKKCKKIDDVYIYCSQETIKEYIFEGFHYLKRDKMHDLSTATMNDILFSFSNEIKADVYVLAHATAPFLSSETIDKGIDAVAEGNCDSVIAVKKMQEFIWQDGKPANYDVNHIPRTQDLPPLFVETTGLYIFTGDVIRKCKSRIGERPFLLEVGKVEAVDINYPLDFEIADAIYSKMAIDDRKAKT
jgi:CMP-N-acetylneuraminic acid synthetase